MRCYNHLMWIEGRDAVKLSQCTEQPLTTKNYAVQNVNSAKIEKRIKQIGRLSGIEEQVCWVISWKWKS